MAKQAKKGKYQSEEMELEHAYRSVSGRSGKKGKKKKSHRKGGAIVICIALIAIAVALAAGYVYLENMDMDKIIQHNVTVAGVNVGGLSQADAIEAVSAVTDSTYGKKALVVTVLDTQAEIPASCVRSFDVKAAVKAAYKYTPTSQSSAPWPIDITPYLNLDTQKIAEVLNDLGSNYNTALKQSTYEVTGSKPEQVLVIQLGTPEYGLDLNKLNQQVLAAYSQNIFTVEGSCGMIEPEPLDLESILAEYYVAPVNASIDPETYEIIPGADGYGFDIDSAKQQLQQAKYGTKLEIPFTAIAPEITAESLEEMFYRDELATFTAAAKSEPNRDTNLRLACEAINGVILYPGDIFSYNDTLGQRTAEKGYKPGPVYVGNKTKLGTGGGICQVSSALYYCAMVADLEILVRKNHGFASTYVPLGMDATINWGTLDLRFRNNTDYPIRIEASASEGNTTVTLIGTDVKDYYVKMEYEVLNTYKYDLTYETMSPNNAEGYKDGDYIEEPYTGYDVKTYRCKYDKQTNELISKDFEAQSKYRKRDGIICKIEDGSATEPDTGATLPGIGNGLVTEDGALPPE